MNGDLNILLFAATTNGFIFQMIDSIIESMVVCLMTWLACNNSHVKQ